MVSYTIKPLNDDDLEHYIIKELEAAKIGINTFNTGAIEVILRSANGNLRLCRNLCYASLIEACREAQKTVTIHMLIKYWYNPIGAITMNC